MHVAAVKHRALDALRLDEGEPRRPIGAEASAPHADAAAVDVVALREMIDPGGIAALGGRIAVEHGVLAGARHVDRQGGDAGAMEKPRGALAILLPAVDPAPMHDHRRLGDARQESADSRRASCLRTGSRRSQAAVGSASPPCGTGAANADRPPSCPACWRRDSDRYGNIRRRGCRARQAPCRRRPPWRARRPSPRKPRPTLHHAAAQWSRSRLVSALTTCSASSRRIPSNGLMLAGAAHDLRLDLVERALLCGCIGHPKRKRCGNAASDQPRCVHVGFLPKDVIGRPRHSGVGLARVIRAPYPTGRDFERSELKRAFCSSVSPS